MQLAQKAVPCRFAIWQFLSAGRYPAHIPADTDWTHQTAVDTKHCTWTVRRHCMNARTRPEIPYFKMLPQPDNKHNTHQSVPNTFMPSVHTKVTLQRSERQNEVLQNNPEVDSSFAYQAQSSSLKTGTDPVE
jgi:hypothetical protein